MTDRWTTPADIAVKARRRWDDGTLLRTFANREPFEPIEIPLRGPTASQIGADLGAARDWVTALDGGRRGDTRYSLVWQTIGGRHVGRNTLPRRAIISTYEQAWALLNVKAAVQQFERLLEARRRRSRGPRVAVPEPVSRNRSGIGVSSTDRRAPMARHASGLPTLPA